MAVPKTSSRQQPIQSPTIDHNDSLHVQQSCPTCAILSFKGDMQCFECMKNPIGNKTKTVPSSRSYSTHWVSANYQHDVFVLEDDEFWKMHSGEHKLAACTSSFSFVRDEDDIPIDISTLETLPSVNKSLYLDNSWYSEADISQVYEDIQHLPQEERQSLLAALKTQHQMPQAVARKAPRRKVNAARREANATEKRFYAKQFAEAKQAEYKSWSQENDVFELIDMRKYNIKNYITGRWVLTIKRDKEGNFLKCKARWVLRGFQDAQHWDLQTDAPTSTRPGFRLQCQAAANNNWDVGHIDLKTAFLQGEEFDNHRDVVCQLPPEAGYPSYMAARLKRAAYGLNDAPRLWWNRLDKSLRSYGLVPTRADRCCYVLYSQLYSSSRKTVTFSQVESADMAHLTQQTPAPAVWEAKSIRPSSKLESSLRPEAIDAALELLLDPITGSPAKDKKVEGIIMIYVDDAFFAGSKHFHGKVIANLRRDFQVGSEDMNDIMFVGQRVKWIDRKDAKKAHISVDQENKIEECLTRLYEMESLVLRIYIHNIEASWVRSTGYKLALSINRVTSLVDVRLLRQRLLLVMFER